MTDTDRTVRELLAEAYDTIVPPGAEHALWRVRVKRALAKEELRAEGVENLPLG
jgi:hypothetical protein